MGSAALAVLVLLAACVPDADSDRTDVASAVTRFDSAGMTVVRHAALPPDSTVLWHVSPEPSLTIGSAPAEEPYMFWRVDAIGRYSDGSIVVADGGALEIKVFSPTGEYVRTLGGRGSGPGEFESLRFTRVIPGDSVLGWDGRLARVSVVARDGSAAQTERVRPPAVGLTRTVTGVFRDRSLLIRIHERDRTDWQGHDGMIPISYRMAVWNHSGRAALDTVVQFAEMRMYGGRLQGRWFAIPMPLSTTYREFSGLTAFYLLPRDRFTFLVFARDGSRALRVDVLEKPHPITDADIAAFKDREIADQERFGEDEIRELQRYFEEVRFAATHPVLDAVVEATSGDIWVQRTPAGTSLSLMGVLTDTAHHRVWHVFSADGDYRAAVRVPPQFTLMHAGERHLLGIWRDDLGVSTVREYRIDRRDR